MTPVAMRLAVRIGAIDKPNERKVHSGSIPRLGGLAIFVSAGLTLALIVLTDHTHVTLSWVVSQRGLAIVGGVVGMLLLGTFDDMFGLKPAYKFAGQIVVSTILYFAGVKISAITVPLGLGVAHLGLLSYPVTILWITGVTNAFNLIDGLDGLASGVALIALAAIVPIVALRNDTYSIYLALVFAGAIAGFLRYNFHPAKVFLGDSGSLMLGLVLAILSIQSSTKGSAVVAIVVPLLALGLPIMETLLSMVRRFLSSFLAEVDHRTPFAAKFGLMFLPDRRHMHHRLLDHGFTHRAAVLALYFMSCILAGGAFLVTVSDDAITPVVILTVAVALYVGMRSLEYKEMSVLHNGILLPLYDRPILNRESFQIFVDVAFFLLSFGAASVITGGPQTQSSRGFVWPGTVAVGIQLLILWCMGLYRRGFRIVGINDILEIVKATLVAEAMTVVIFVLFSRQLGTVAPGAYVLDFFFLLSLILGSRCSHLILQHLFRQEIKTGRKVVIYGANSEGLWMLERILQLNFVGIAPVGFVDDDSSIVGKRLNGYPVYNSNGQLSKLAKDGKLSEIVICTDKIKPEHLQRLQEFAHENSVVLTRAQIVFEEIKGVSPAATATQPSTVRVRRQSARNAEEEKVHSIPQVISGMPATST